MNPPSIDHLLDGYRRFRTGDWLAERTRWEQLAAGQNPRVMVIACSDSRVDPAMIFDTPPGEIFVVRNVANLVPPFETTPGRHGVSAALEYAVTVLEVSDVLVIGHGACGGVRAALERPFEGAAPGEGGFVAGWMSALDEARARIVASHGTGEAAIRPLELEGVRASLANLRTFPFIPPRVAAGTLRLRGAHFAIADGGLLVLDEASDEFLPVPARADARAEP